MSYTSYTNIWLHLLWGTHKRERSLCDKDFRKRISRYLSEYSNDKGIYMKTNFVNIDHVHALITLPTNKTLEDIFHLLKGASSYWINQQVNYKFRWAKGYAAFSLSESDLNSVIGYINNQEEHHRRKSFSDEYNTLIEIFVNQKRFDTT